MLMRLFWTASASPLFHFFILLCFYHWLEVRTPRPFGTAVWVWNAAGSPYPVNISPNFGSLLLGHLCFGFSVKQKHIVVLYRTIKKKPLREYSENIFAAHIFCDWLFVRVSFDPALDLYSFALISFFQGSRSRKKWFYESSPYGK